MELMEKYGSFINNEFVYGSKEVPCINPANGKPFAQIGAGDAATVDAAVAAAKAAFPAFKKTSKVERAKLLRAMADRLEENIDLIAKAECLDTGKTLGEAKLHEIFNLDTYRYFASAIETKEEVAIAQDSGTISYVIREPLGVAGLIVAWNCPPMLLAWKLAPALAMGNTVVIKPSITAVAAVAETLRIWQDLLPKGVVNMVLGSSGDIGDHFIHHPDIAKLSFTGSVEAGRAIGAAAGQNIIPATLELGGKSASVCFEDADIDRFVEKSCMGILNSAGEICVANSRLIVQDTIYDQVIAALKEKFDKAVLGDPMDPKTQIGPLTEKKHMEKVLAYIEAGKAEGATLVTGGYRYTENGCENGYYVKPTIFGDVKPGMKIEQEEIFGPVVCVMKFHTEEEALAMANDTEYGLAGAVWTKDIYRAIQFGQEMQAGILWVNDYLDTGLAQPFGGVKNSGIGREVNKMALEHYSQVKNICFATDRSIPPVY
jgi:acyl-CoA reductase-like NAD-dependent aldehyde dehydrogenase